MSQLKWGESWSCQSLYIDIYVYFSNKGKLNKVKKKQK